MSPRLVPCTCDSSWNGGRGAMSVCPTCERRVEMEELHRLLVRRGFVRPVVQTVYDVLIAASERRLDELDAMDRAHAAAPSRP